MSLAARDYLEAPSAAKIARHGPEIDKAVSVALTSGSQRAIGDLPPDLADEARRRLDAQLAAKGQTTRSFTTPDEMTVSWA